MLRKQDGLAKDRDTPHRKSHGRRCSGKLVPVDAAHDSGVAQNQGLERYRYHFVIGPDGRCQEGRPLYRPGAHCNVGHRNFIGIGVCLVGNFSETEVPDSQLVGLVNKVVQLMEAFKLGIEAVELHKDVPGAATECPGRYFPKDIFMKKLEEGFS